MIKGWWWKFGGVLLLIYVIYSGLTLELPDLNVLDNSIRNLFFHVPMWFAMMFMMLISLIYSIKYLGQKEDASLLDGDIIQNSKKIKFDIIASQWATVALFLGVLGLITGAIWAKVTWGAWWVIQEVKLNGAAAGMLVYCAYFILRGSIEDAEQKARISAVYNIFAFVMYMVFINVIPRLVESSLHPGNGGNPGFSAYDLDNSLRMIFYPAIIGWILLGAWIVDLRIRTKFIETKKIFSK